MNDLVFRDEVYAIVGAAMEVYNELRWGFLEPVYQEALGLEPSARGIPFEAQRELSISYKGRRLQKGYVADLVAYGQIIVELKALDHLTSREHAQVLNYLKATGHTLGVLLNFGHKDGLEWKRLVRARDPRISANLHE